MMQMLAVLAVISLAVMVAMPAYAVVTSLSLSEPSFTSEQDFAFSGITMRVDGRCNHQEFQWRFQAELYLPFCRMLTESFETIPEPGQKFLLHLESILPRHSRAPEKKKMG